MQGEPLSAQKLQEAALDRLYLDRRALLSSVRNLFAGQQSAFTDREATLFTGILSHLTSRLEADLRRGLAEHLSGHADVPPALILALADETDEMASVGQIFEPAIMAPLVEAAFHRMMAHLVADSAAVDLASPFAGERQVTIRLLLSRPEAAIVEAAQAYLVREARRLNAFQDPVLGIEDLRPVEAEILLWRLTAVLRRQVARQFDVDTTLVDEGLEKTALSLINAATVQSDPAPQPAERLAEVLIAKDRLGPEILEDLLQQGEIALFEAMFARLLGIPVRQARRVFYARDQLDFAYACRALDLSVAQYAALNDLLWHGRLAPSDDPELPVSEVYEAVDSEESRRLLGFWRRDRRYAEAVELAHAIERGHDDS